jgi:hypothetical protein
MSGKLEWGTLKEYIKDIDISNGYSTVALLLVLLIGYNGLWRLIDWIRPLPEEVYHGPSITVGAMSEGLFVILLVVPSLILFFGRHELTWNQFEHGRALRIFIMLAALPFVWTYVTYDYNLYFDQAHHLDRALLLILYGLIWYHPAFVYPFLLIAIAILGQFFHPFGHYDGKKDQYL